MNLEVINVVDTDDGGAVMTLELDAEMLFAMAKIGLMKVLTDAAAQTIEEHGADGV